MEHLHLDLLLAVLISMVGAKSYAQQTSLTVDNQSPGWLSSRIGYGDQQTVENLKIIGYLNGTDFNFLIQMQQEYNLKSLDLSDANIVKGGEDVLISTYSGSTSIMRNEVSILENNTLYGQMFFPFVNLKKLITPKSAMYTNETLCLNADTVILNGLFKKAALYSQTKGSGRVGTRQYAYSIHVLEITEGIDSISLKADNSTATYSAPWEEMCQLTLPSTLTKLSHLRIEKGNIISRIEHPENVTYNDCPIYGDTIFIPQGTTERYKSSGFRGMRVFVEMNSPEAIQIVNLINPVIKLYKGESSSISIQYVPEQVFYKDLIWTSNDESIVTVNQNGKVQAIAPGMAEIIVSSAKNPDATDKCTIAVYDHTTGISMPSEGYTINVGESTQIEANTLPLGTSDGEIIWSSDNEEIATVDSHGIVTAIKPGSCVIKATSVDGGYVAECLIVIAQPAATLSLSKQSLSLLAGSTEMLIASVLPENTTNKLILWSSDNTTVAEINEEGMVTAKKSGKAVIMAIAASNPEAKDVCEVTVIQPVTGITMTESQVTCHQLGEIKQLVAIVQPEDATNKEVRWNSSNPSVCTISESGIIAVVGVGTSVITATTVEGGFVATCIVKVIESDMLVVTAKSYTREYGDDNPSFEFTSSGTELNGVPEISCEATATSSVGTYPIVIKKGSVTNENDSYINGTLTITKAPLTIKAGEYTKRQGDENPEFELTYEGFKNGETKDILISQPTVMTAATADSPIGDYEVVVSGAEAQNYEISYVNGILTITEADGIDSMNHVPLTKYSVIYNITGQRLSKPQRGVNIVDGKKVIIK